MASPKKQKHTKKTKSSKKDDVRRVKGVFGDPQENIKTLVQTSVAVKSLPKKIQGKLVKALHQLPEGKQVKAVQTLQKEQGAYKALTVHNFEAGKKALLKLKNLKDQYKRKQTQLIEKYDRLEEQKHSSALLS